MNAWFALDEWSVAGIIARWTVLLALAWFGHWALARRNPRWRVAIWRLTMVGIAAVGMLALAPPVLTVPVVPRNVARTDVPETAPSPARGHENGSGRRSVPFQSRESTPFDVEILAPVQPPVTTARRIVAALVGVWIAGAAVLAARLALAWFGLARMIRRSDDVAAPIVTQCDEVAKTMGAPAVRVVSSAEMATPCLAGLRRPVLLLPARALPHDELRSVLAHELAHARGHDLVWNLVAHVTTIVLWFHPLVWRLRAAHAAACDAVCDAMAADFLGDVSTYAKTLARLALVAHAPIPGPGLAMARSSEVRRRIEALNRGVFRLPLPRWRALSAAICTCGLLVLLGGVAVTVAQPLENTKPSGKTAASNAPEAVPVADGRLELQAQIAASGMPIEGVAIVWDLRINGGRYKKKVTSTGRAGRAILEWPKGATVNGLQVTARKAGFVPYVIHWDDRAHPLRLPATKTLKFVPGTTIGGVVKDEAGSPVAGAKITVYAPPTETEASNYSPDLVNTRTDDEGRWRADDVAADLRGMNVSVQATGFIRGGIPPSRDLNTVIVLKRGLVVKGRVVDLQGKPIAGVKVSGGDYWSQEPKPTKTDARGEFVLQHFPPGSSLVTVMAAGFAPDLQEIHAGDRPTLEFRLGPGHVLRGKIIDQEGRPVAGATLAADTWRAHHSLSFRVNTDSDGRFEWRGAPKDPVLYSVFKPGYKSRGREALTVDGPEHVITLDPELVISGRVTDSATGQPVPAFRMMKGFAFSNKPPLSWSVRDASTFIDGRYTLKYADRWAESPAGYAVRVEADGYKPAESRVFKPNEGAVSFDFKLSRAGAADLLSGVILRPDGRPALGAEIALATPGHPLLFEREQVTFGRQNGMSFARTDRDGRFSFNKPEGPYLLAAMSEDGYAEATPEAFVKATTMRLEAWGRIQGMVKIGRNFVANERIYVTRRRNRPPEPRGVHAFYGIQTRTDAQGRFVFDRVIPGASEVSRLVVTEFGNGSSQEMGCWQEPVDIAPGQTVLVRIGGKGRPVVGRVKAAPGAHVDWRQNRPATIQRARSFNRFPGGLGQDPHQFDRFAANLDKDGRFRVEDVPPGRYELTITIDAPPVLNRPGPAKELGRVTVPVSVPDGDQSVPIDLGEIAAGVKGQ